MCMQMADVLIDCFGVSIMDYLFKERTNSSPTMTREKALKGLRNLFHYHLLQLRCNSHSVSVMEVGDSGHGSTGKMEKESGELVECVREIQLGSAVFPTASLFNHSCWPNVIFR